MSTLGRNGAKAVGLGAVSHLVLAIGLSGNVLAQAGSGANQASPSAGNSTSLSPLIVESTPPRRARKQATQTSSRRRTAGTVRTEANRGSGEQQAAGSAGAGARGGESAWAPVDGYVATRSASGTKTDTPLIETPAAISVVTRDEVQAQAAQTVPQAVRYTSGVRGEPQGADNRFDRIFIRGFEADQYLDSMRLITTGFGFSSSIIEPYNLARIEVLHGPASVLYGQSSPRGIVDLVSKRPTDQPYHEMFFSTGSYGRVQGGVDLSGPIDPNKEWLYRFTASGFDVGTQVDHTKYQRVSIAPSLTWRPDRDTSITFLGTYQNDPKAGFFNQLPARGVGTLFPFPNGQFIPTSFYPGEPSIDKMSRERAQIGYLAEHRFDNIWTVRQNLRYTDLSSHITTIFPIGVSSSNPPSLARSGFFENDRIRTFTIDNQAEARFALGPFSHTMLLGLDYQKGTWAATSGSATTTVPAIKIFEPDYGISVPMTATATNRQDFDQLGLYAQDQIKLDHWVALLGVRWDQADSNTQNLLTNATTAHLSDDATTKRAALLYKFDNGIAPYIQYTESFQPTVGTDLSGNPFKPTTGKQEEAGVKYQPDPKSLYTLAVFNLTQQNVLTPDPDPTLAGRGNRVQTGEIRSRGIELEGKTEINRSLSLLASYTYLDDVITKSNTPLQAGRRPAGIPTHAASLWADYTFHGGPLDGFGLAGGVRYLGETAGNISGPTVVTVPGVTLFDAALHYDLAALGPQFKGFQFQINATNLFDKTYVNYCGDNGCFYGLRREVIATLRYRW
jgi:iron complex outermembrane receptor protein